MRRCGGGMGNRLDLISLYGIHTHTHTPQEILKKNKEKVFKEKQNWKPFFFFLHFVSMPQAMKILVWSGSRGIRTSLSGGCSSQGRLPEPFRWWGEAALQHPGFWRWEALLSSGPTHYFYVNYFFNNPNNYESNWYRVVLFPRNQLGKSIYANEFLSIVVVQIRTGRTGV